MWRNIWRAAERSIVVNHIYEGDRTDAFSVRPCRIRGAGKRDWWSNHNSLDLIEAELVAPAIVELRRARRSVVGHRRSFFQCAAVLEIRRDPGCPAAVMAALGRDASRGPEPAGHCT